MKLRSLAILLILLLSLIPAYYITQRLREFLQPRRSLLRLLLFLLASLVLVVMYTLILVGLIVKLFPLH